MKTDVFVRFCLRRAGAVIAAFLFCIATRAEEKGGIEWQPWSDDIFQRAKAENRFVLLDLGAGWCHWCHVMEEITYRDEKVIGLVRSKYIAVHVDQDARPDLANRYEDYGWPATIVFNADGGEIVKRRGYLPPKPMASMLQAIIDDPTPGPSVEPEPIVTVAVEGALGGEQRAAMRELLIDAYDKERGGWGDVHKYLNWDALEYCITEGRAGDAQMERMARQTLASGLRLIDPVWGGVYQYSTDGDWEHPHFEKIMPFQAENLRTFSLAASLWHEPKWLAAAQSIRGFLRNFLTSPEGAFYTSQDADVIPGEHSGEYFVLDDAGRRKFGVPRVDQHIYARENGLAITGLAALYAASGDATCLADAKSAAEWILAHRSLGEGGFRHDDKNAAGPYLADTLAMGRAFLALYTVTGERTWLARAEAAARFVDERFRSPLGFATAAAAAAGLPPKPQVDEQIAIVRLANLLHHHTGEEAYRAMALHAMRYLAAPAVVERQGYGTSGILLADRELRSEPPHITVVGAKDDPAAQALFATALREAPGYQRMEWFDAREGALPRQDVEFPAGGPASAFFCVNGACSLPMRTSEALAKRLRHPGP